MDVVPVIDLKAGQVVGAGLERHMTPTPQDLAAGLFRSSPFGRLYIADLDAREGDASLGSAAHLAAIASIAAVVPGVELWIDSNISTQAAAVAWLAEHPHTLVIASQSQTGVELVQALRDEPRVLLSLDFRADEFQGPLGLHIDPGFWPRRLIVRRGADVESGPDFDRVEKIIARAGSRTIYAAGGVRNGDDVERLRQAGAAGILVASGSYSRALTHQAPAPPAG